MSTRKRTKAREIAAQLLYQQAIWQRIADAEPDVQPPSSVAAVAPVPVDADVDVDVEEFVTGASDDPEVRDFARTLYHGAVEVAPHADELIAEVADHWKLDRIATMDRVILRLAIYELEELAEVPAKVVLNEAIDLAKKYSTAQSGSFINGILDRLLFLRGDGATPPERRPSARNGEGERGGDPNGSQESTC